MPTTLVRFYGRLADEVGPELSLEIGPEGISVARLRADLAEKFGARALLQQQVRVVVNAEMIGDDREVRAGDEVEFLAPLSGG